MTIGRSECGVQYAVRRSSSAVGYCALSIRCGTRDEAGYENGMRDRNGYHSGIAHFVEHTLFKGTAKRKASAISSCLDRLGGELNAYTTKEEIVIHAPVLKEDLHKAASLLFELVTCPVFPEDEVATEKGVVIDEINSYKDSPSEEVYDRFEELLFEGHPLSGPILGTVASVKKIGRAELVRFVREKFRPENMAFTVVADIPEDRMERSVNRLVTRYFGGSGTGSSDSPAFADRSGRIPGGHCQLRSCGVKAHHFDIVQNRRNHQVNCVIGAAAPSLYDDNRLAAVLLSNMLGGPASNSILNSILREKNGWVYGVECSYTQYSDTGIMAICLGCDRENLDKCLKAIDREIDRLKSAPVSGRRLQAAKKQLLGQLAISGDNGETQCLSMGKSLLSYGRILTSEESRDLICSITPEQIRDAACSIFGSDRLSRLIFT